MKKITCSILALIFWIFCMASGRSLVVVGADDSAPLPGATVFTRAGIIAGITDSCGVISGLSAADYPLSVKYLGFEKGTAPSGTDTLRLRESSLGLGEVLVTPADRPVLKITLYMREYECRTLPGDTLIMFNEHMADCYIPTAKRSSKPSEFRRYAPRDVTTAGSRQTSTPSGVLLCSTIPSRGPTWSNFLPKTVRQRTAPFRHPLRIHAR